MTDLAAGKAVYTALLGAPHTDEPYSVGYDVDGFEIGLAPGGARAGRRDSLTRRSPSVFMPFNVL